MGTVTWTQTRRARAGVSALEDGMAIVSQEQIRCARCNRRLADLVNEIEFGHACVELKCPRCGWRHLQVISSRPPERLTED
jgi:phage FluMu protein Com